MNPDILIQRAVDGVLDVLESYQVPKENLLEVAKLAIDALRNVMSVSDAQRLQDEIRTRSR